MGSGLSHKENPNQMLIDQNIQLQNSLKIALEAEGSAIGTMNELKGQR